MRKHLTPFRILNKYCKKPQRTEKHAESRTEEHVAYVMHTKEHASGGENGTEH